MVSRPCRLTARDPSNPQIALTTAPAGRKVWGLGRYWKFFWPLGLMSLALQSGAIYRNFVLLDLPDGVRALALFTLAQSVVQPLMASLVFSSQLSTIMVKSRGDLKACLKFFLGFILALEIILNVIAWTPAGPALVPALFTIGPEEVEEVLRYLKIFGPILFFHGAMAFMNGLLVRAHRTGLLTLSRIFNLCLLLLNLSIGLRISDDPVAIIGWSWGIADGLTLALVIWFFMRKCPALPSETANSPPGLPTLLRFFLPMALTSIMFALNRPILFNILTRLNPDQDPAGPDVTGLIAAVSLALSFGFIFQGQVNQYRHVGATFAKQDPSGCRAFLAQLSGGVTALYLLGVFSPFARVFLERIQGAPPAIAEDARQTLFLLLPVPIIVGWRNFFHSLAMVHRRTAIMGIAALNRNLVTALGGLAFLWTGTLSPVGAGMVILAGFAAEALTVTPWRTRRRSHALN